MDKKESNCDAIADEKSCWREASDKLRAEDPKLYGQLEEILAPQGQTLSRGDMSGQVAQSVMTSKSRLEDRSLPFSRKNRNENEKAKARKAMDSILKAVTVFRDMGSIVATLDPMHVGLAWGGVNVILQLVLGGAEQNAAALEGLGQISPIITRYAKVEEIYLESKQTQPDINLKEDFRTQVVNLYASILVYQVAIISHSKRHSIVQYARALPKLDNWSQQLEEILRLDEECRKFTQIFDSQDQMIQHRELKDILKEQDQQMENVSRQLDRVSEQTQEIVNRADQQENQKILDWISSAPPNDDHTRVLEHGKLNSEYANSGQWLFSRPEFQSWNDAADDGESVLWLRGAVGTGKSSLVCLIIEHFLKQEPVLCKEVDWLAYFYCSKKQGAEEASSPKTILRSILRQLAWSSSDLSVALVIKEKYQQDQQAQGHGGRELLADDCVKLITQLINARHDTTIIIDALDECSDFYELLGHLEEIVSACGGKAKFLLSSRMNVPLKQIFPTSATVEVGLGSKEDIDYFIRTEMKRNEGRLRQCKALDLKDQMIEVLSDRAQGMFRWVELQLDTFFNPKSRIKRRDAFKRKLEKLDKEIGSPVLDDVYDDIYQMNTPEPEDRSVAERALLWIMCCQNNASIQMLVEAVSLDSDGEVDEAVDAEYILDICSNFIIVDHNQLVQFAHLSVREYLMNSTTHGYTMTAANAQVARTCLLYLLANDAIDTSADMEDQFLDYATWWWPFHCSQASVDGGITNPVQDLLSKFLNPATPSGGFIRCLEVWQDVFADILNNPNAFDSHVRMSASLNPANSPIFTACAWGFFEVVRTALSCGSSWDNQNSGGDTALAVAVNSSNIEIVRLLLENGADINAVGFIGDAVLYSKHEPLQLVKLLVDRGLDITQAIKGPARKDTTRLHLAAYYNQEDVVRFLLSNGATVNAQDHESSTALHLTASSRDTGIAQVLLEHGANAGLKNNEDETALHMAAATGNEAMVKLLLEHQGLMSCSDKWIRETRFNNAMFSGDEATVLSMLEEGDNIYIGGLRRETPLHWAVQNGRAQVIPALLQKGADIDALDSNHETPLLRACMFENVEMVEYLLENGADIHLDQGKDEEGRKCSPLSIMTFRGMPEMVELLLERGADPRSVDIDSLDRRRQSQTDIYISPEGFAKAVEIVRSYLS